MPVEEMLSHELREVADGLQVPTLPPLPQERPRTRRHWQPLLVVAAVVLVVAAVAAVASYRSETPPPATKPTPTPAEPHMVRPLTTNAPTVPYVFDGRLYVHGEPLAGRWWTVEQNGNAWVAHRDDDTWWWGTDADSRALPGKVLLQPQLSPDGALIAVATTHDGGQVLLIDTQTGRTLRTLRLDASGHTNAPGVVAVTDDGRVFLQSDTQRLMWLAADGEETVNLDTTAPEQWVRGSTPAGLIVLDGTREGEHDAMYLADVSASGEFTRLRALPGEDLVVNPSGTWLAYGGSWGGESQTSSEITAQPIDGSRQLTLPPPDDLQLLATAWEDDQLLLAELHTDGIPTGLARCSIFEHRCVRIDTN